MSIKYLGMASQHRYANREESTQWFLLFSWDELVVFNESALSIVMVPLSGWRWLLALRDERRWVS